MKKKTLSPVQQMIVNALTDGWKLFTSRPICYLITPWVRLEKEGEETQDITSATFQALKNKGVIVEVPDSRFGNTIEYVLDTPETRC